RVGPLPGRGAGAAGQAHPRLLPGARRLRPGARGLRVRRRRGEAGRDPVRHRPEGEQQPGAPVGDPADPGGEAGPPGVPQDSLSGKREKESGPPAPLPPAKGRRPSISGGGGLGDGEGGPEQMSAEARWFGRAVWLGILADWVLAVPTIFAPQWVLRTLGVRPSGDPVWTAFAALLVFLLSLFYIPAATTPARYRFGAWMRVLARPPGVIFFLLLNPGYYPAFGLVDGILFVIQFPLLLLLVRSWPPEADGEREPLQARPEDRSSAWLKRTLWLGILADWVLGVPSIFAPEAVLDAVGLRRTGDPVWTAFAALILVLLGIFYVPGANHPYRYRANAWLAVFARPPGVVFFWLLWRGFYPSFGLLDGVLFLLQFPFLVKTLQLIPE